MALFADPSNLESAPQPSQTEKPLILETDEHGFMVEVIEESMQRPVIVDFQAEWCGPCKQLGPMLERIVQEAAGAVRLVKIDIDKSPGLAGQLRIQSIPMVYAFYQGQPVHGFAGAQAESQIKQFIAEVMERCNVQPPPQSSEAMKQAIREQLDAQHFDEAVMLAQEFCRQSGGDADALLLLVEALLGQGAIDEAESVINQLEGQQPVPKGLPRLKELLRLKQKSHEKDAIAKLEQIITETPDDHASRFELSEILMAEQRYEAAMNMLLEIIRLDPQWEEEKARHQLLSYFEIIGNGDPAVLKARRRLSSLLFS